MEKKKLGFINPKKEPLTIERLREMTGQNYTDQEAQEIVSNIKTLSSILVEHLLEESKRTIATHSK